MDNNKHSPTTFFHFVDYIHDVSSKQKKHTKRKPRFSNYKLGNPRSRYALLFFSVILFFLFPIAFFSLREPTQSEAAWYNNLWLYRKSITIDKSVVSGSSDLSNFPFLISITDPSLPIYAQNDGDDILFTYSDGTTKLDHEVEFFNSATGELVAWVKLPTLSPNSHTTIYMYAGNSSAANQESPTSVWDSNYIGVWHMSEDPSGSAPQLQDSTSHNRDLTSNGSMTSGDLIAGKIGNGIDFDGVNDYLTTGTGTLSNLTGFTLSGWIRSTSTSNNQGFFGQNDLVELGYWGYPNIRGYSRVDVNTPPSNAYPNNNWYFTVMTWDGSSAKIYINGVLEVSVTKTTHGSTAYNFNIGGGGIWGSSNDWFRGLIDEVRLSNSARSADWLTTEYNNQNDPSFYLTLGMQEVITSATLGQDPYKFLNENSIGYWSLDEDTGPSLDKSGNSNNTEWSTLVGSALGRYGNGVDLERTDNAYLYAEDSPSLSITGSLTIGAWIKPESNTAATQFNIAGKWDGTNESYLLSQYGDEIRLYIDSSSSYVTTTSANLSTGTWYHVIGVYDNKTATAKYILTAKRALLPLLVLYPLLLEMIPEGFISVPKIAQQLLLTSMTG